MSNRLPKRAKPLKSSSPKPVFDSIEDLRSAMKIAELRQANRAPISRRKLLTGAASI